jgi:hypothetical protein
MVRGLLLCVASLAVSSSAHATEGSADSRPAVERKLIGDWRGGPCMGTIHFDADRKFRREHYTPGNNFVSGSWELRWDALPPALVFQGTDSDAPERLIKDLTVLLTLLNDEALEYRIGDGPPSRYERVKEKK